MAAVAQKHVFFSQKIFSPTGNTLESLQCIIYHHNSPEGESCPFKVITLVRAKMFDITQLYVGTYGEK